jgi:PAS domain S-box-containing protein
MTKQVKPQLLRRRLIFLAVFCTFLVVAFWFNDSYAIWSLWNDPNLCENPECQAKMYRVFFTDMAQILVYLVVSVVAIRFFIRDFDYRTKQMSTQKKAQLEVQDLYDNAPCGYHSLDANGVFIHINQTELRWLGYTKEEIIGKMRLADLQESFTKEQFLADFKANLEGDGVKNLELNLRRKDGSIFTVLINGSMIRDENGVFIHTRSTLTDFSEQRSLLNELEKAREIAEKSVETKERFMANMSHEIRTPMNALMGFTNLLERTELTEKQKEFLKIIKTSGGNLLTLINDLLDFSKIEAGMLRIEATNFDIHEQIHSVDMLFRPKAQEKKVDFDVSISSKIPQMLNGDPTRVSQIVVNLLSNAFKFTERGYVTLSAELFDDNTDYATIKITVKDTGIGIKSQELPRIFQRFQQAQDDTTRLYGGSGLGLAIVKNLAEAMGGFVEADSKIGFGSTFSVILPFKKAIQKATDTENGTPQYKPDFGVKMDKNRLESPNSQPKKSRILVVEDNPMNQRLASFLLTEWGYDFEIVEDGHQAINKVQTSDFQLIMMDIQLPVMDGYEATAAIRNQLKSTVPIIATTAHAFAGEREKCLAAGMNDYIPKPLQEVEVLAIIQKYINE